MPLNTTSLQRLTLVVALLITSIVYGTGLPGGFIFDDWPNLIQNKQVQINEINIENLKIAWNAGATGGLGRPLSVVTFGINHAFSGMSPAAFKATNIGIHLLNGLLIWILTHALLSAFAQTQRDAVTSTHIRWIAVAVAACWLLHPINVTTVLYVVQRMTQLSALFVLLGLALYCKARLYQIDGKRGALLIAIALIICLPLGVLSKENGVLLIPLLVLFEASVFRLQGLDRNGRTLLIAIGCAVFLLPLLFAASYLITHPTWLTDRYERRPFSLSERVLSECRILWHYLRWILLPSLGEMGLFHDDIPASRGILSPPLTAPALLGIIGLIALAASSLVRPTIAGIGTAFFLIGHSLESTIVPLELVFEHRNYLPLFGVALIVFYYLLLPQFSPKTFRLRVIASILLIGLFSLLSIHRSHIWSDPIQLDIEAVRRHPESPRANLFLGRDYTIAAAAEEDKTRKIQLIEKGLSYCGKATQLDKNDVEGLFCQAILENMKEGAVNSETLDSLTNRLRSGLPEPAYLGWITMLARNWNEPTFMLPVPTVVAIINAALSNPRLTERMRTNLLTQASTYAIGAMKNIDAALSFSNEAIRERPEDPQYHLNLAKVLRHAGRFDEADTALDTAFRKDPKGRLRKAIESERDQVARLRHGS